MQTNFSAPNMRLHIIFIGKDNADANENRNRHNRMEFLRISDKERL